GGDGNGLGAGDCGAGSGGRLGCAVHLDGDQLPPRGETAPMRIDGDGEALGGRAAGEPHAQEIPFLEGVADTVVQVEAAAAVLAGLRWGVNAKGQRSLRLLIRALDQRLLGNDGAGADEDRQGVEAAMDVNLGLGYAG